MSSAWAAGLALAALLAYGARTARPRALALVPLAVAVAAAGLILRLPADEGPWRPDPSLTRPVCDGGTPRVCVTTLDRKLLPALSEALAPVNARLRGLPGAPARWAVGPLDPRPGDVQLLDPAADAVRGRIEAADLYRNFAVMQLFSDTCRAGDLAGPNAERAMTVNAAVIEWLAPTPDGFGPDVTGAQPHIDRLRAKSPAAQRDYLARYLAANTCHPDEVPIP